MFLLYLEKRKMCFKEMINIVKKIPSVTECTLKLFVYTVYNVTFFAFLQNSLVPYDCIET